jgi:hypothetical protein
MVSIRNLALAASSIISLASAAPAEVAARQFTAGTQNNTREFYITMQVTSGLETYNGWQSTSLIPPLN